ncbi:MAG: basic secretory protein-like protein [Ferruginibacter sp.]
MRLADVITHELMHSVQGYGYNNVPAWVTEGIADYVRATEGINNAKANWAMPDWNASQHYSNAYRITARFFVWITQNYKADFVNRLDDAARKQTYTEATYKDITGKTLDELWKAYIANPVLK